MAKEKQNLAVVEQQGGALAIPDELFGALAAKAEVEKSDFKAEDVITPALRIIQTNSPQVKRTASEFIEGAEAGMLYNTATNEIYDGGIGVVVIPCYFYTGWIEWKPKKAGGGLVKKWEKDERFKPHFLDALENPIYNPTPEQQEKLSLKHVNPGYTEEKGKWVKKNSAGENEFEIVNVANYYVLLLNTSTCFAKPAIIRLSSTEFKKSKRWASIISSLEIVSPDKTRVIEGSKIPYWSTYNIKSIPESNDSGDWFGVHISKYKLVLEFPNGRDLIKQAQEFRDLALEGNVKTIEHSQEEETTDNGSDNV